MKRSIFTIVAALALVLAAPVVAQQEEEPYENRTNPDARSIAPGSGLTLTGTVVEWNDEQLVVRSATGVEHFQILPDTQKPVDLQPGQNVSVDYTRTSQGVMIAQQIRPEGVEAEVTTDTTVDTTSSLTTETELDEPDVTAGLETEADADLESDLDTDVDADLDTDVETTTADADFESDLDADVTADTSVDESLPATGSTLPLAGLLGLLGLAAALGLRSFLR